MPINDPSLDSPPAGAIRFNTDSRKIEVYCGGPVGFGTTTTTGSWFQIDSFTPNVGIGTTFAAGSSQGSGVRAVINAGESPSIRTDIQYINVSSTGNSVDFGTLSSADGRGNCPFSDRTRGIFSGGSPNPGTVSMVFVTISSTGNTTTFGNLTTASIYGMSVSNSTRGIRAGAFFANQNVIDYVTIQSTGDAQDFGDLLQSAAHGASNMSSTRGVFAGGYISPGPTATTNVIQFITISTTGNAVDFGDLVTGNRWNCGGNCNSTRGLIGGGNIPTAVNTIEYITLSASGNSIDFGDLTRTGTHTGGGACSPTRGVFTGGYVAPAGVNIMDYVSIMSLGNAVDFGDLITVGRFNAYACSNGHGGL